MARPTPESLPYMCVIDSTYNTVLYMSVSHEATDALFRSLSPAPLSHCPISGDTLSLASIP